MFLNKFNFKSDKKLKAGSQASKNIGIPTQSSSASIKSLKKVMRLRGGCDDCCDREPGPRNSGGGGVGCGGGGGSC